MSHVAKQFMLMASVVNKRDLCQQFIEILHFNSKQKKRLKIRIKADFVEKRLPIKISHSDI